MRPGRGNDQSIRRVTMKRSWQVVEFNHYFNVERYNLHYIGGRRFTQPDVEGPIQSQPALCVEHLCFS